MTREPRKVRIRPAGRGQKKPAHISGQTKVLIRNNDGFNDVLFRSLKSALEKGLVKFDGASVRWLRHGT